MAVAAGGWALEPDTWARDAPMHTELTTPLYGHPNPFGLVFHFFVEAHDATGILLFVTCLVPLFARMGGTTHVRFGRAFVVIWLLHLVDGLANSGRILAGAWLRAHALPRRDRAGLLALSLSAVRVHLGDGHRLPAPRPGGDPPQEPPAHRGAARGDARDAALERAARRRAGALGRAAPRAWWSCGDAEHVPVRDRVPRAGAAVPLSHRQERAVLAPAQSSRLAPGLAHRAPAQLDVLCAGHALHGRGEHRVRVRAAVSRPFSSRRSIWASSSGCSRKSARSAGRSCARASRWRSWPRSRSIDASIGPRSCRSTWRGVARHFDLDRSGHLDRAEIDAALATQGIELAPHELDVLMEKIDLDGDRRVTTEELATFLAHWFGPEPSDEGPARDRVPCARPRWRRPHRARRAPACDSRRGRAVCRRSTRDSLLEVADLDGDGSLDMDELRAAMRPTRV
jgi:hypothetical protein